MRLFRAFGEIAINGMDQVDKAFRRIEAAGMRIGQSLNVAGDRVKQAGESISQGLTIPILAAVGALTALSLRTVNYITDLRQASRQMGVSVRDLQSLRRAFDSVLTEAQVDTFLGTLQGGINDFVRDGSGALATFFEDARRYGVTAQQMARMTPVAQLELLFRSVRRGSNSFEEFRAELASIGPEFAALARQYWDGGAGIFDQMAEDASTRPGVISDNLLRLEEEWSSISRRMGDALLEITNKVAEAWLPVMIQMGEVFLSDVVPVLERGIELLQSMSQWFLSLSDSTQAWIIGVVAVAAALGPILFIVGGLIKAFGALILIGTSLITGLRLVAVGIAAMAGPIAIAASFLSTLGAALLALGRGLLVLALGPVGVFVAVVAASFAIFYSLIQAGIGLWNQYGGTILGVLSSIGSFFTTTLPEWGSMLVSWAADAVNGIIGWFARLPDAVMGFIGRMTRGAVDAVRSMARTIGDTLASLYDRVVGNSIIPDMASEVLDEINSMADGSIAQTRRMAAGMEDALPPSMDISNARAAASARFGRESGNVTYDMRNSIFRDDRDMLERMRRRGGEPQGVV